MYTQKAQPSIIQKNLLLIAGIGAAAALASYAVYEYHLKPKTQKKRRLTFKMQIKESDPSNERIVVTDLSVVKGKLRKLREDGLANLQIISDYDQTISPAELDGRPCPATFGILRMSEFISPIVKDGMQECYLKYSPIEADPNLSLEQKLPKLKSWIDEVSQLLSTESIPGIKLEESFANSNTGVRSGFIEYFKSIINLKIPFYIVSGGVTDFVELVFDNILPGWEKAGLVEIHANKFLLDSKLILRGLAEPHIHTLVKSTVLDGKKKKYRKNVLLFGDLTTDPFMASGVGADTILNIGFLNADVEKQLHRYQQKFDILICNDGSYNLANKIIAYVNGTAPAEELENILDSLNDANNTFSA